MRDTSQMRISIKQEETCRFIQLGKRISPAAYCGLRSKRISAKLIAWPWRRSLKRGARIATARSQLAGTLITCSQSIAADSTMSVIELLEWKCGTDTNLIKIRKERIERWTVIRKYTKPPVTEEQRQAWKTEVENLAKAIDAA